MQFYQDLIEKLNKATEAYDAGKPYMSDHEWDELYWQLVLWEQTHGIALSNSPTQQIHYKVVNKLLKVGHSYPMLSLDKTKSLSELNEFCGNRSAFISFKMDGLTCRLTYENGKLVRAETRGDGTIGEDITHNAMVMPSVPKRILYKDKLIVDGEVVCFDYDFVDFQKEYANSRNFAAGSIRLLDSHECEKRKLTFVAWEVVEGFEEIRDAVDRLKNLDQFGFSIVVHERIEEPIDEGYVNSLRLLAKTEGHPIDGLVVKYCDIDFARSLGMTAHHRRDGLAYKFFDESVPTILRDIEWSMGRTGKLTPVAIFDEIELEGTKVSRANLHNLSIMWDTLQCKKSGTILTPITPQTIYVYKANQIIPQIKCSDPVEDINYDFVKMPMRCPCCGEATMPKVENNTSALWCLNRSCSGKLINKLDHFCGKKGLDIKGLSVATLEKLIDWNWVNSFSDIFELRNHYSEWIEKPGFGKASVEKILDAIEYAQYNSTHESFISAIGIPLIGRTMVKELMKSGLESYEQLQDWVEKKYDLSDINGFGYEKSNSILNFDYKEADKAYDLMVLITPKSEEKKEKSLEGKTIVITGTLKNFKNRSELQAVIEAAGGKVVGSVSKNTTYLINNDIESNSSKNLTAKKLGVPIITEEKFLEII